MKIEISVEGQEPLYHKLKSQKTLIGSGADCDVVLQADGISRKHAAIVSDGDKYFVVDEGSTNGSFINEERLTPGTKALFTSFFPVKLGFHVTVTLMDDDTSDVGGGFSFAETLKNPEPSIKKTSSPASTRAKPSSASASRSVGKNLEGSASKTKKGVPRKSSKSSKSEDEKRMGTTKLLAFLLVAGSVAYFYWDKKQMEEAMIAAEPPKIEEQVKQVETQLVQQSYEGIQPKGIESGENAVNIMKCSFPLEKAVCSGMGLPHKDYSISGMVMTANAYVLVLPSLRQESKTFDFFREERGWRWDYRPLFNGEHDERDIAALYLVRAGGAVWKDLAEEDKRDWVFVLFVNSQGVRVGDMLFAKADSLIEVMQSPQIDSLKEQSKSAGISPFFNISGLFRKINP